MEIRNTNIEIRKNWNKFSFKKLGIMFCLFLFGIVTFISGNLPQVNAASSSTVLPIAKGGTGSNSASGARTNLNAQETLVSGTNIKSIFGQSLLGSGNLNPITINKTSGLTNGETTYISGTGTQTFYGITCTFDTGICTWTQNPYTDSFLIYDAGDGVLKSVFKNAQWKTISVSIKLFGAEWTYGHATGMISNTTGFYKCNFYKGDGLGFVLYITRIR